MERISEREIKQEKKEFLKERKKRKKENLGDIVSNFFLIKETKNIKRSKSPKLKNKN